MKERTKKKASNRKKRRVKKITFNVSPPIATWLSSWAKRGKMTRRRLLRKIFVALRGNRCVLIRSDLAQILTDKYKTRPHEELNLRFPFAWSDALKAKIHEDDESMKLVLERAYRVLYEDKDMEKLKETIRKAKDEGRLISINEWSHERRKKDSGTSSK